MMAKSKTRSESMYGTPSLPLSKKEGDDLSYYILMTIIIFALAGGIIIVGGMLRFTLAMFILFLIGFNLVYWSVEKTEKSDIWERVGELDEEVNLRLKESSSFFRRAYKGMELSQGYLEKRVVDLFKEKLKDNRNLSENDVIELLNEPDEFRELVDDEIISDFILFKENRDEDGFIDDQSNKKERLKGEDYERWVSTLLKRIEGWE